jgi:5-methylcytosine-specific restriction endonuclease McrA
LGRRRSSGRFFWTWFFETLGALSRSSAKTLLLRPTSGRAKLLPGTIAAELICMLKRAQRADTEAEKQRGSPDGMTGASIGASEQPVEKTEWVRAHEALSRLARERAAADAEEGRWLLAALRSAAHVHLGYGSFGEYVERLFGYKARSTQEKLRVAEALEELPAVAQALETGRVNWSAARELTRVAVVDTEQEWLDVARGKTVHQLEALVAGKGPGDKPASANQPDARRHVLRFDVAPETLALFREAMSKLRRGGIPLDDDSALMLMARHVLGGPGDEGRASYQIALSVCPECGKGHQQASGELVPVGAEVVAMADCDGQHLGPLPARGAHEGPAANEGAHVGAQRPRERSESKGVGTTATPPKKAARAKQGIPPATRRAVLRRDHHRCVVPGCRNSLFLDLHHVKTRSQGGGNDADNLITLCGVHHRAAHRGELSVEGSVSAGIRFRHADGTDYGQALEPRLVDIRAKAFAALRGLGFREIEVRRVLADSHNRRDDREMDIERVVRDALAKLTAPRAHS